jgi:hypothetical protein
MPVALLHTIKHMQELEKRYYSNSAAGDAASAKAAAADLAALAAFFSQRGWATLSVPSSTSSSGEAKPVKQLTEEDYRELDSQLDEVCCSPVHALSLPPLPAPPHPLDGAPLWLLTWSPTMLKATSCRPD